MVQNRTNSLVSFLVGGVLILLGVFSLLEAAAGNFPYTWSLIIGLIFLGLGGIKAYLRKRRGALAMSARLWILMAIGMGFG